jgi:hypothetical protein
MVVAVVVVLAAFEQRAELDRLVRLVMVHGTHFEAGKAHRQSGGQGNRHEGADAPARHLGRP